MARGIGRWSWLLVALAGAWSAGCASPVVEPARESLAPWSSEPVAGAGARVAGGEGESASGDRVVLELRLGEPPSERVLLLEIELTGQRGPNMRASGRLTFPAGMVAADAWAGRILLESPSRIVRIRTLDEAGRELESATEEYPEVLLDVGPSAWASLVVEADGDGRPDDNRVSRAAIGLMSMTSYSSDALSRGSIADLLKDMVRLDQALGYAMSPRAELSPVAVRRVAPADVPEAWRGLGPLHELDLELSLGGGGPTLVGTIVVAEARAPLGLGAGLVSGRFENVRDARKRLSIRLLEADRGEGTALGSAWRVDVERDE
jgi:hypothetical protein